MSKQGCPRCGNEKHRGRCKKSAVVDVPTSEEEPAGAAIAEFELAAGWPAQVKAEPGWLSIIQTRADPEDGVEYRHEIRLQPHQARQFADRLAELIEKAAA